jgi:hypothetical protein
MRGPVLTAGLIESARYIKLNRPAARLDELIL